LETAMRKRVTTFLPVWTHGRTRARGAVGAMTARRRDRRPGIAWTVIGPALGDAARNVSGFRIQVSNSASSQLRRAGRQGWNGEPNICACTSYVSCPKSAAPGTPCAQWKQRLSAYVTVVYEPKKGQCPPNGLRNKNFCRRNGRERFRYTTYVREEEARAKCQKRERGLVPMRNRDGGAAMFSRGSESRAGRARGPGLEGVGIGGGRRGRRGRRGGRGGGTR